MNRKIKSAPLLLAPPLTYTYYITYQYDGGFGCAVRVMEYPLNNWDRINITATLVQKDAAIKKRVILTNWILL